MLVNLSVMHHCLIANCKFDSVRILQMSREQQDVQSFADGNLQHELDLSI